MSETVPAIPGISRKLLWLDRLSRVAASVVMAILLFTVASSTISPPILQATLPDPTPTARAVPPPLEKPWLWARPAQDFEAMYSSRTD